tara:strand:+ start:479 stop:1240 length:762 start_codon:yes stop_codon:yes gene_type:complete
MIKTVTPYIGAITLMLAVTSCTTELRSQRLGETINPEVIPGKIFIPFKSSANVGDVMLTAGEYSKEATGLRTEAFNVKENTTTQVKHKASSFEFSLPAGDYRLHSKVAGGKYYSAPEPFTGLNGTRRGFGGLFVPNGASEATEFYWNWVPDVQNCYQAKLVSPINGNIGKSIVYLKDQENSGPRATLTYAGVASGQISFVYKEFTEGGLARPAFTQEVSLDYVPNGTYSYKDALFTVENANSILINFTLQNPL